MSWSRETGEADTTRDTGCQCELTENIEMFQKQPVFRGLSPEIIKLYAYLAKRKNFQKGDFVFRQGERCRQAYLILSGEVQAMLEKQDRVLQLDSWGPMEFFGQIALLAEFDWPLSVKALTDAHLVALERDSFRKIMTRYPQETMIIVERIVQSRLQRMQKHMLVLINHIEDQQTVANLSRNIQL